MKAQASALVDVPTALFCSADQGVQYVRKYLCECLEYVTDSDLESSSTMKKVNAWICAPPTTDHDLASVIPDKKRKSVTRVIFADLLSLD